MLNLCTFWIFKSQIVLEDLESAAGLSLNLKCVLSFGKDASDNTHFNFS